MTLEECYLSILKNNNSWNPTKSYKYRWRNIGILRNSCKDAISKRYETMFPGGV